MPYFNHVHKGRTGEFMKWGRGMTKNKKTLCTTIPRYYYCSHCRHCRYPSSGNQIKSITNYKIENSSGRGHDECHKDFKDFKDDTPGLLVISAENKEASCPSSRVGR